MRNLFTFSTLLAVSLLALTGCDFASSGSDVEVYPTGDVLMPLDIGNTWTYRKADGEPFGLEAAYTVTQDGVTATIVDDSDGDSLDTKSAFWAGNDGLYVAEYHPRDDDLDPAGVFLRFPAEGGAAYSFGGKDIRVTYEKIEVPAGTFATYTYVVESGVEGTTRWSFAPDLGILRLSNDGGFTIALTSYEIK